ncbi:hypothetical protein COCSUDRAFT_58077 [Coccomyxa subellipsoidea C-169]|uniref:Uncharacterized protein n=1 Tax=Coccomyxa subellipsoidea (strain C-169) TaxID=574566 RepID=I0YN71_COCSC|nr:hypothetical protein COCSUDRAFT_58077 [Coccomyxa subellipsoidea C-169]EIE19840.1 hypothetical protein COCSUDRAFT_58077 [Coccomyxa subellipsoidea C-169]|eukprot:XP_005644384.1 hypothetical protein COCSUDRAFT_58077 [Coccomyxa subellipsoidea C-169]
MAERFWRDDELGYKQPSSPVNMADAERKAAREAKSVAAAAASAAAAERQHTSPMVEVHLHRQQSMASLIEEADITLLCPTGLTFGQMSQLLSQRHVSLRGRQVFYRVRDPSQQSVAASTVLESETVGSLAARQPNCRQDLHVEFVATTAGGLLS